MQEYKIKRTGLISLRFDGVVLKNIDGYHIEGDKPTRWHDLNLYKTKAGKFVLELNYRSIWGREYSHYSAFVMQSLDELESVLTDYDPLQFVEGFPVRPEFEKKQKNLLNWINRRFEIQVSAMLDSIDGLTESIA